MSIQIRAKLGKEFNFIEKQDSSLANINIRDRALKVQEISYKHDSFLSCDDKSMYQTSMNPGTLMAGSITSFNH